MIDSSTRWDQMITTWLIFNGMSAASTAGIIEEKKNT